MHFVWHANQPGNLELVLLLNDINTRTGVATSTDQNQAGLNHGATVTKSELLGMLIKRCVSDCAMARSIRGQALNGASSCISIQAGRVMKLVSLVAFNTTSRWSACYMAYSNSVCTQ